MPRLTAIANVKIDRGYLLGIADASFNDDISGLPGLTIGSLLDCILKLKVKPADLTGDSSIYSKSIMGMVAPQRNVQAYGENTHTSGAINTYGVFTSLRILDSPCRGILLWAHSPSSVGTMYRWNLAVGAISIMIYDAPLKWTTDVGQQVQFVGLFPIGGLTNDNVQLRIKNETVANATLVFKYQILEMFTGA